VCTIHCVTLSGLEVATDKLSFSLLCDDAAPVQFRCASVGEARFWVHCIQRALLVRAAGKRKDGADAAAAGKSKQLQRHTLGGASGWAKFSKTNMFCGALFDVFTASETGRRRTMEDECVVVHDLNHALGLDTSLYPPQALFALYDGHAGRGAVDFCVQHMNRMLGAMTGGDARAYQAVLQRSGTSSGTASLTTSSSSATPPSLAASDAALYDDDASPPQTPKVVGASDPLLLTRPALALRTAFVHCDAQFREAACESGDVSGTTAIVAVLRARRLFVANAGDSRAVLCRGTQAVDLSTDHKPNPELVDEIQRIEDAGGWITSHQVLNVPKLYALGLDEDEIDEEAEELVGWVTVRRVNGVLGMTRSLGDVLIKDLREQQFADAEFKDGADLVIADPEVTTHEVQTGDQFFIMASDGLWDVFTSQEAVDFVRKHDDRTRSARQFLVQELVNEALERGSIDNISILLVFFNTDHFGAQPPPTHQSELGIFKSKKQAFSRRFAVLSQRERTLLFYRSRTDMLESKPALDQLLLQNVKACHEVAPTAPAAPGDRALFQLTIGGTTTLLAAANDDERRQWIQLLSNAKFASN
jgi:serine/threonine protein phosphatase PrpC